MCSGLVIASNTRARGASKRRVRQMSVSDVGVTVKVSLFAAVLTGMFRLLRLEFLEVGVEAVEAAFPDLPIALGPFGDVLERRGLEAARSELGFASARDEPGTFEHTEVLGDRGHGHAERSSELRDGALPGHESGENRAPCGIGEGGERGAESIGRHGYLTNR